MTNGVGSDTNSPRDEMGDVLSRVRQLDPTSEEAAVRRYVREIAGGGSAPRHRRPGRCAAPGSFLRLVADKDLGDEQLRTRPCSILASEPRATDFGDACGRQLTSCASALERIEATEPELHAWVLVDRRSGAASRRTSPSTSY